MSTNNKEATLLSRLCFYYLTKGFPLSDNTLNIMPIVATCCWLSFAVPIYGTIAIVPIAVPARWFTCSLAIDCQTAAIPEGK